MFDLWEFTQNKLSIPSQQELDNVMMSLDMDKILADDAMMTKASAQVHVDLSSIARDTALADWQRDLNNTKSPTTWLKSGEEMVVSGVKPNGEPRTSRLKSPCLLSERYRKSSLPTSLRQL
nr:FAD:protein FMN transferase [Vibrio alginolyticus]